MRGLSREDAALRFPPLEYKIKPASRFEGGQAVHQFSMNKSKHCWNMTSQPFSGIRCRIRWTVTEEYFRKSKIHLITFVKLGLKVIYAKISSLGYQEDINHLTQESLLLRETHQHLQGKKVVFACCSAPKFFHILGKESWVHIIWYSIDCNGWTLLSLPWDLPKHDHTQ